MTKEKLHELRRRRAALHAKMMAIIKQEDDLPEGESLPEDAVAQFHELQTQIAALDGRIQRLEEALQAQAQEANGNGAIEDDDDANGEGSRNLGGFRIRVPTVPATATKMKKGPGLQAARFVYALMYRRHHGLSMDKTAEFIVTRFGDVEVAKALNTIVTGEGGALIPQDFLADLIELLRASTVVRGSDPMTIGMPMGNLTIPRLAGGATATYQAELDDIGVSQERFDDVNFVAKKLTAMVPVSNDLIRRAPIGVEEVVRDDLIQTIARREDLAFLRGDGTDLGPTGFRTLVLPGNVLAIPAMEPDTPGAGLNAVVAGLQALILLLQNGLSRMIKPTWIMAPTTVRFIGAQRDQVGGFYYKDEIATGRLEGIPYKLTTQIPTNLGTGNGSEIYLAAFEDVVIADTYNVIVDASDVAAYKDTTGDMVSTFQRDQSLFRVISEHDFNMRHLQSLAVGTTVDWYFTGMTGLPGRPWTTQPLNPTWSKAPAIRPALATGAQAPPALADPK